MCGRLFVLCEFESRCVRRSAAGLELGPLTFGGTRSAGLQPAINLPAGFPPTRCCFSWHELQSSMHISHLPSRRLHSKRRAHTLSQTQPVARHNRTNERIRLSCWVGGDDLPTAPARPGLDASSSSSPDVRAPALYYCRALPSGGQRHSAGSGRGILVQVRRY